VQYRRENVLVKKSHPCCGKNYEVVDFHSNIFVMKIIKLVNSFNKTEAAIFPMKAMLPGPEDYPFYSDSYQTQEIKQLQHTQ